MKRDTFIDILLEIRELLLKQKEILTIDEVSNYTSFEKSYIYKMTSSRVIPHYKTAGGKKIFFRKDEIDEWLTSKKIKTKLELNNEADKYLKIFKKN